MTIFYRLMRDDDIDETAACITHAFVAHEPLTSTLNVAAAEFNTHAKNICAKVAREQLSMIAVHRGRIIGARLAAQHDSHHFPESRCPKMNFIAALLQQLHQTDKLSDLSGTRLHLIMMGVHEQYNNRGIAQHLLLKTLSHAKKRGFHSAIVEATSPTTQYIFEKKFNFKIINSLFYKTFRHAGQTMLKNISDDYSRCALLEKTL